MGRQVRFLSAEDVFRIHRIAMLDQGAEPVLRDLGLLDSALAMPKQQFDGKYLHPDIPSMAAAYAFHIATNHPFEDGNKRAAVAAMIQFLSDNGWCFDATADEAEPVILKLAAAQLTKGELTQWLTGFCREKPSIELRDFFASLTPEQMQQVNDAMKGGRLPELGASVLEASRAMPLIHSLRQTIEHHNAKGEQEHGLMSAAYLNFLVMIYRLAEDMGYEW